MGRIAKQKSIEVENVKPTKTKTKKKVSEEIAVCNKELVKVENKPKVKIGSNAYKHIPIEDILQKIQSNQFITSWEDLGNELGCTKQTLYNKLDADQHQTVNEYLEQNKARIKQYIRGKLANTKSIAGLIALYKLLATQDERAALTMSNNNAVVTNQYQDNTVEIKIE